MELSRRKKIIETLQDLVVLELIKDTNKTWSWDHRRVWIPLENIEGDAKLKGRDGCRALVTSDELHASAGRLFLQGHITVRADYRGISVSIKEEGE